VMTAGTLLYTLVHHQVLLGWQNGHSITYQNLSSRTLVSGGDSVVLQLMLGTLVRKNDAAFNRPRGAVGTLGSSAAPRASQAAPRTSQAAPRASQAAPRASHLPLARFHPLQSNRSLFTLALLGFRASFFHEQTRGCTRFAPLHGAFLPLPGVVFFNRQQGPPVEPMP